MSLASIFATSASLNAARVSGAIRSALDGRQ
jgi:hypothetical protein